MSLDSRRDGDVAENHPNLCTDSEEPNHNSAGGDEPEIISGMVEGESLNSRCHLILFRGHRC